MIGFEYTSLATLSTVRYAYILQVNPLKSDHLHLNSTICRNVPAHLLGREARPTSDVNRQRVYLGAYMAHSEISMPFWGSLGHRNRCVLDELAYQTRSGHGYTSNNFVFVELAQPQVECHRENVGHMHHRKSSSEKTVGYSV